MATLPAVKQFSDRVNRIEISATMAVVAEAAKLKASGADLVEFGAGEPHFSTPQHIKDAAIAAINNNCTRYTAVAGVQELRTAITRRHAVDFGSMYQPGECMVSTGGKLALFNAIQVLVDHGDEVIVPVPYWVSFKDIIERHHHQHAQQSQRRCAESGRFSGDRADGTPARHLCACRRMLRLPEFYGAAVLSWFHY
jgi:aspartate aminotransferase